MQVICVPVSRQDLLVHLWSAAEFGQSLRPLLLFDPREKHVAENLWYFEDVSDHRFELLPAYALARGLAKYLLNSFVKFAYFRLLYGLALRIVELWHKLLVVWICALVSHRAPYACASVHGARRTLIVL